MFTDQMRKRLAMFGVMLILAGVLSVLVLQASLDIEPQRNLLKGLDALYGVPSVIGVDVAVAQDDHTQPTHLTLAPVSSNGTFADFEGMSPGEAFTNGKPTILFVQPAELCQIRYCRPPADMTQEVQDRYHGDVNFVYVPTYAVPADVRPQSYLQLPYANWGIYPVPSYSDWLPKPTMTEFGLNLEAPMLLVIDSGGNLIYRGGEFVQMAELEPYLQDF